MVGFPKFVLAFSVLCLSAAGSEAAERIPLERFVPEEILTAVAAIPPADRDRLCKNSGVAVAQLQSLAPGEKVAGLLSNMANLATASGAQNLERFAGAFSEVATAAYVSRNEALKGALVEALANWASAGAYLRTADCSRGRCKKDWRDPAGGDLSSISDHGFTVSRIMQIGFVYDTLLRDFRSGDLASAHDAIQGWFAAFVKRLDNRKIKTVAFGNSLDWAWPNLLVDLVNGDGEGFAKRLDVVAKGLDKLLQVDGSFKGRTTRGAAALRYHTMALEELFFTLEILKANGIDEYGKLAERLHRAVGIFVNAADDPMAILPWAVAGYRNNGDPTRQDFDRKQFLMTDLGSSWAYIYLHRFPRHPNATLLKSMLTGTSRLQGRDSMLGLNVGCLYRILDKDLREIEGTGRSKFETTIVEYPLTFGRARVSLSTDSLFGEEYSFSFYGVKLGDREIFGVNYRIIAVYSDWHKQEQSLALLRLQVDTNSLDEVSRSAGLEECGPNAYNAEARELRLHFGDERVLNECVLRKLSPADQAFWYSVYANAGRVVNEAASQGDPAAQKLLELFKAKAG